MDLVPITPDGMEALRKELARIKTVERPKTIAAIEEARAHGDLSENAEYKAAKERQAYFETRMAELEFKIGHAQVIDPAKAPKDRVAFGATVVLENADTNEEITYQLVGPDESDVNKGRISVTSPIGRAMMGKVPDDAINVQTPSGMRRYVIVEIL